jgi:ubiquinone/menaquinone biosynthesis C-methylase UbiE
MSALTGTAPAPAEDVSPDLIFQTISAFQKTAAIRAAIELDLFSAIAAGSDTPATIAAASGAAERGVRVVCDFLATLGIITKREGHYALTPSSATFLDRRSPSYLGGSAAFLIDPQYAALFFDDPARFVRNGGAQGLAVVAPDNPVWVAFAEGMGRNPLIAGSVEALAAEVGRWRDKPGKVLDIAAGHGLFGINIAKVAPVAEIVAVDWAPVLVLARRNAKAAGVEARYTTIAGSAFDVDWGKDYDLVLLPNFLHHFDEATCTALLKKVRKSLTPNGSVIVVEFVASEDGVSAPFGANFSFVMLATTPAGEAYTETQLDGMARTAGFTSVSISPVPHSPASIVTFKG